MKEILSGNEAIARGAFEAGVRVASAYPGTPSTEILETIAERFRDIDAAWSPNEKVALEVGTGAAFAGGRALVTMKHVGLNVAADPLFTVAYTGVSGALVVVSAAGTHAPCLRCKAIRRHAVGGQAIDVTRHAHIARGPNLPASAAARRHTFQRHFSA